MAEFLTKGVIMALSSARESTFNTQATGNFERFVTEGRQFFVPTIEKFDNAGKIGLGQEFATAQFNGYLNPVQMDLNSDFDSFVHAMLMLRACGDTDTQAALAGADVGAASHTFKVVPTIDRLPSFSVVWALGDQAGGGADYIWTGCVVDNFRIEQSRSDIPQFSSTIIGSGKNVLNTSAAVYSAYKNPSFCIGAETEIYYGATPTYLATRSVGNEIQKITNWNLALNNSNRTDDRRPGDPRLGADPSSGHYVDRITLGDQREITSECSIVMDDTLAEVAASINNTLVTDFTIETRGTIIIPAGAQQFGTKFQFPKAYLNVEEGTDDNGTAILRTTVKPVYDSVSSSILDVTVFNDTLTAIA